MQSTPIPTAIRAADALADTVGLQSVQILIPRAAKPPVQKGGLSSWFSFIPQDGTWAGILGFVALVLLLLLLVLAIVGTIFLIGRILHGLRHYPWGEPPRRMKRLSFGKEGVSWEYVEGQLEDNQQKDVLQEIKLAELRSLLDNLSGKHDLLSSEVARIPPTMAELIQGLQASIEAIEARLRPTEAPLEERNG